MQGNLSLFRRGAGKSTPHACLVENTIWDLIDDIEKLREHLKILEWCCLVGGSWGSTLSLAYSQSHPDKVTAMILRGIFLLRKKEIDWFYEGGGGAAIFPDAWETFRDLIPENGRGCFINAYNKRLNSNDMETQGRYDVCYPMMSAWDLHKFWPEADFKELPVHQRGDAVSSLVYEANARVRDAVYGCVGDISYLQNQVYHLEMQLAEAQAEILCIRMQHEEPTLPTHIDYYHHHQQHAEKSLLLSNNNYNFDQYLGFVSSSSSNIVIQDHLKRS